MPNLLTLVPFRERHIEAIRKALGNDWTIEVHEPADQTNPTAICSGKYELSEDELVDALKRADIVIGEPAPAALRKAADEGANIKLLQMTWAGTDKYTRSQVAFPKGTSLCNAVGGFGQIISQYVLAQTLSLMQNLPMYRDQQFEGRWQDLGEVASLDGAKVLIFGAGNIGSQIALRMKGFNCEITGVCRNTTIPRDGFDKLVTLSDAEKPLAVADVVACAVPNNDETAGWLSGSRIATMKPNAVIVNVGRGNFIDCDALAEALSAGKIRGAALDVTNPEPLPSDHALWREPHCIITPHVSGGSFGRHAQTEDNICAICCRNLKAFLNSDDLINEVDEDAFAVPRA